MSSRTIGSLIVAFTVCATAAPVSLYGQASCTAEMNRQDAALQRFGSQTNRDVGGFVADDAARAAFGDDFVEGTKKSYEQAKAILKGDPTAGAYEEFKQKWEAYLEYIRKGKKLSDVLGRTMDCYSRRGSDCTKELRDYNSDASQLLDKSHDAMQRWIKSLDNDNITKAAERAERARGITEKIANRAQNLATGAMSGAMQNCMRDFQQRVQVATREPVDLSSPPKGGAGKAIAVVALATGAGVGTAIAVKKGLDAIDAAKQTGSGGSSSSGSSGSSSGQITFTSGSIQCVAQGGGSFGSTCTGTIALNVGVSVPARSLLIIVTDPSQFMASRTVDSAGAPNALSFQVSQSRTNVDFSGNISCYPTQSRVLLFRDSTSGTPLGSASSNIQVTCTR